MLLLVPPELPLSDQEKQCHELIMWISVRNCPCGSCHPANQHSVDCLNRSDHDAIDNISEASFGAEELLNGAGFDGKDSITDHPFLALKKLLSDGTFYYSLDFNLTDRLQDR